MNSTISRVVLLANLILLATFTSCKKEDEGCTNSTDITLTIDGGVHVISELRMEGITVAGPSFGAPENYDCGIVFIELITQQGERIQFDGFSFLDEATNNAQTFNGSYGHAELGNYSSCASSTGPCKLYKGSYFPNRYGGDTYRSVDNVDFDSYNITTAADGTISGSMKMLAVSENTTEQTEVELQFSGICFQSPLD